MIIDTKEVAKFVDGIIEEENRKRPHQAWTQRWTEQDVKTVMFNAVVQAINYFKEDERSRPIARHVTETILDFESEIEYIKELDQKAGRKESK